MNLADVACRGGDVERREFWCCGSEWIPNPDHWPQDIVTQPITESNAEAKATKELFATVPNATDRIDAVLEKFDLNKAMRICAWIARFVYNSLHSN